LQQDPFFHFAIAFLYSEYREGFFSPAVLHMHDQYFSATLGVTQLSFMHSFSFLQNIDLQRTQHGHDSLAGADLQISEI
jgi:hypothetical protein